jgi:hypothetical protein
MDSRSTEDRLVFLDACCLINFFATGHVEDILRDLPLRFAVSELIADREVLTLRPGTVSSGSPEREAVSVRALETAARLEIVELESDEELTEFTRFAAELDDGEASVCALAVVHGGAVATDDRKALRVLGRTQPPVPTLQTSELLFDWARQAQLSADEVRKVLQAVRDRARFHPRRSAPHFLWWSGFLRCRRVATRAAAGTVRPPDAGR